MRCTKIQKITKIKFLAKILHIFEVYRYLSRSSRSDDNFLAFFGERCSEVYRYLSTSSRYFFGKLIIMFYGFLDLIKLPCKLNFFKIRVTALFLFSLVLPKYLCFIFSIIFRQFNYLYSLNRWRAKNLRSFLFQ